MGWDALTRDVKEKAISNDSKLMLFENLDKQHSKGDIFMLKETIWTSKDYAAAHGFCFGASIKGVPGVGLKGKQC